MGRPNQKIFLNFLVLSFLFAPSSLQAADSQLAWVKTAVANDTFTGKVVGVSDGDTISVMRGGRAVKVRLHGIASMGKVPEGKDMFRICARSARASPRTRNSIYALEQYVTFDCYIFAKNLQLELLSNHFGH